MVGALAGVLPDSAVVAPDADRWASLGAMPEAVVSPASVEQVATLMAWASAESVGVVPAGSGRRLGARTMRDRFVVVTTDRLTGVEIYEPADVTFTAKAGTRLADIDAELRPHRQWLPFDPPNRQDRDRTLAGLVAAGVSGPLSMGYGALRNHVLGMTVVTGDGRVLRLGGRVVKNVAGFDLLKPVVGSRGTLGVITSVCMRAFPVPACDRCLVVRGGDHRDPVSLAMAVATAPMVPVSCVVRWDPDREGDGAELTVRLHGAQATVDEDQRVLEEHVGVTFEVAASVPERERPADVVLTVSVLPSRLPDALRVVGREGVAFATIDTHAGRLRVGMRDFDPGAVVAMRDAIEDLGGGLSVEQGPPGVDMVGLDSRASADVAELEAGITGVFDPLGVLWGQRD
jgi:glycolate oxidase FAD binding subunit